MKKPRHAWAFSIASSYTDVLRQYSVINLEKIILPFIIAGVVGGVAAAVAVYKKYNPPPISVGRFAIWGRPNVGKSTFINRLMHKPISAQKEGTTSRINYKNIPLVKIGAAEYRIEEIVDMPGTKDRLSDWLKFVDSHEHVFYLVNLARRDDPYIAGVKADLNATRLALNASTKRDRRLHIVASHVDQSTFKTVDVSQLNNALQKDDDFCLLYESIGDVAGYVYVADLTDHGSFTRLLESVLRDSHA